MLIIRRSTLLLICCAVALGALAQGPPPPEYHATVGTGEQGNTNLQLSLPSGVFVGRHNMLLVADRDNDRVQVFDSVNQYVTTLVHGFSSPADVVQAPNGTVYVADRNNHRIQTFDEHYNYQGELSAAQGNSPDANFDQPMAVAVDAQGNLYVADYGNHRIQIFSASLGYLGTITGPSGDQLKKPTSVCIDPRTQEIVVADYGNHRVLIFDENYQLTKTLAGAASANPELFTDPYGVAVDSEGILYVSDQKHRVQAFNAALEPLFTVGTGRIGTTDSTFKYPAGLTVDELNRLYVADFYNHRVQIFSPPAPRVILSSPAEEWTNQDYSVTFSFNKRVVDFDVERVSLTNASLSELSTSDSTTFHGQVSPHSDGKVTVEVPVGVVHDHRGVANPLAGHHQLTFNTVPPQLDLFSPPGDTLGADTLLMALAVNEPISGLSASDITLHNATLDTLLAPGIHHQRSHWSDELLSSYDMAINTQGKLYVSVGGYRIQVYDEQLQFQEILGDSQTPDMVFSDPRGLFIDREDRLYVTEPDSFRVQVFDAQRNHLRTFRPGRLLEVDQGYVGHPYRISGDSRGNIFITGQQSNYIQVFEPGF